MPAPLTKNYGLIVSRLINDWRPQTILDVGAGSGWLPAALSYGPTIDGIDWNFREVPGYATYRAANINNGFPEGLSQYHCVVCCEVIALLTNPGILFSEANRHLPIGGKFIISTPNSLYPQSRLQYFMRGFHSGFPSLAGKLMWGQHMHLIPWSFPQIYNFLMLHGFRDITLHEVPEPKPKSLHEWCLGAPAWLYAAWKRKNGSIESRDFWKMAGSRQAMFGRRMLISASKGEEFCVPV